MGAGYLAADFEYILHSLISLHFGGWDIYIRLAFDTDRSRNTNEL